MAYKKDAVDLSKGRETVKSRIKLVGIELEGIWTTLPKGVKWVGRIHPQLGELGRDGSLDPLQMRYPQHEMCGELPSLPMPESEVASWCRAHWPQIVSKECGLHVHISVKNPLQYMRLMDERYPATVIHYLKKWAEKEKLPPEDPAWERLLGQSIYCQHLYMADEQVKNMQKDYEKHRVGHRYTAINYCFSRSGLGTIECRVLPITADAELGIRGIQEFLSTTNKFLAATAVKEKKYRTTLTLKDEGGSISRLRASV